MTAGPSVVLTGIGSVSALGIGGAQVVAAGVARGLPGVAPLRAFPTDGLRSRLGGEVGDLSGHLDPDEARRLPRASQLVLVAVRLALLDAGLEPGGVTGLGLVVGSHWGDLRSSEAFFRGYLARGPLGLSPLVFPSTVMNAMGAHAAIAVGARGPMLTLNQAGGAGEAAVARGAAFVATERAAAVLAGGVDELSPTLFRELVRLGVTSPALGSVEGCRPFDRRADGTVLGEGATFVLLEAEPAARARGARIYARLEGSSAGVVPRPARGRTPRRRPGPAGPGVIGAALARAGRRPGDLRAAYLTGLGDPAVDRCELDLLAVACGDEPVPPVAALTPLVGDHAGLGALRVAAAATVTLGRGQVPTLPDLKDPVRPELVPGRSAAQGMSGPEEGRTAVLVHGLGPRGVAVALVLGQAPAGQTA